MEKIVITETTKTTNDLQGLSVYVEMASGYIQLSFVIVF